MKHRVQEAKKGHLGLRQLANIVYSATFSLRGNWKGALLLELARTTEWRMSNFSVQGLANKVWVCDGEPAGCTVVCSVGEGSRVTSL